MRHRRRRHRAVEVNTRDRPETDRVVEAYRQTEESWRETWREEIESRSREP